MTRRPSRGATAPARAAIASLLLAVLVAACSPSAVAPTPVAVRNPSITAATQAPTPVPTRAPSTPAATPEPAGVIDDDVEGDPDAVQALPPTIEATPAPTATPVPKPTPMPTPAPPKEPFAVSLYHKGDWVGQYTLTWCVGASIQMMVNIALPGQDRTEATQAEYMRMAQGREELNLDRGAGSWGWARTLGELGVGEYRVAYETSFEAAVRAAARAMAFTKRPVGLLVWGGRHAWVMTGFTSIGDPRIHDDAEITGVRVLDPLYPRHNSDLGPAPEPNALLKPGTLDDYFVGWRWRIRNTTIPSSGTGSWRLVLPVSA